MHTFTHNYALAGPKCRKHIQQAVEILGYCSKNMATVTSIAHSHCEQRTALGQNSLINFAGSLAHHHCTNTIFPTLPEDPPYGLRCCAFLHLY